MVYKILELLLLIFVFTKCSVVIDQHDQKFLIAEEYCKKTGMCLPGTHVMCTQYNPNRIMGPQCLNPKNVSMTPEYADLILTIINKIRSRIANGRVVAKNPLPRGYGIFRLQWDSELATFAQVWANQCKPGKDMCYASKNFPDPGQLLYTLYFTDPDWMPLLPNELENNEGFSNEKVNLGIKLALKFWYDKKNFTNSKHILGTERWDDFFKNYPFLQIIHGSTTHVGCGVAAYQRLYEKENNTLMLCNIIRLVCNFSHRPIEEEGIYTTDPPSEVGFTSKCGCPLGYDEDEDCLCYESQRGLPYSCKYGLCKPHFVVVPIISVEDAPRHLLKNTSEYKISQVDAIIHHNQNKHLRRFDSPSRSSIFTKSSIFQLLPKIENQNKIDLHVIRKNVRPRKDFSNMSEIVSNYLSKRRNETFGLDKITNRDNKQNLPCNNKTEYKTERFIGQFYSKESEKNLMNLLNEIEEEAKEIQLKNNDKEVIDRKIRKIYESFIRKLLSDGKDKKVNKYEDEVKTIKSMEYGNIEHKNSIILNKNESTIKKYDFNFITSKELKYVRRTIY